MRYFLFISFSAAVARHHMSRRDFHQLRLFLHTAILAVRAAVAERAARRQVQRTGRLALDVLYFLGKIHVDVKDGVEERP